MCRVIRRNEILKNDLKWYDGIVGTVRLYEDSNTGPGHAINSVECDRDTFIGPGNPTLLEECISPFSMHQSDKVMRRYESLRLRLSADNLRRDVQIANSSEGEPKGAKVVIFWSCVRVYCSTFLF